MEEQINPGAGADADSPKPVPKLVLTDEANDYANKAAFNPDDFDIVHACPMQMSGAMQDGRFLFAGIHVPLSMKTDHYLRVCAYIHMQTSMDIHGQIRILGDRKQDSFEDKFRVTTETTDYFVLRQLYFSENTFDLEFKCIKILMSIGFTNNIILAKGGQNVAIEGMWFEVLKAAIL